LCGYPYLYIDLSLRICLSRDGFELDMRIGRYGALFVWTGTSVDTAVGSLGAGTAGRAAGGEVIVMLV